MWNKIKIWIGTYLCPLYAPWELLKSFRKKIGKSFKQKMSRCPEFLNLNCFHSYKHFMLVFIIFYLFWVLQLVYNLYQLKYNFCILEHCLVALFTTIFFCLGISVMLEVFNYFVILVQWTWHMCIDAVLSAGSNIIITLYL